MRIVVERVRPSGRVPLSLFILNGNFVVEVQSRIDIDEHTDPIWHELEVASGLGPVLLTPEQVTRLSRLQIRDGTFRISEPNGNRVTVDYEEELEVIVNVEQFDRECVNQLVYLLEVNQAAMGFRVLRSPASDGREL